MAFCLEDPASDLVPAFQTVRDQVHPACLETHRGKGESRAQVQVRLGRDPSSEAQSSEARAPSLGVASSGDPFFPGGRDPQVRIDSSWVPCQNALVFQFG